jgi:hypothetical protein
MTDTCKRNWIQIFEQICYGTLNAIDNQRILQSIPMILNYSPKLWMLCLQTKIEHTERSRANGSTKLVLDLQ